MNSLQPVSVTAHCIAAMTLTLVASGVNPAANGQQPITLSVGDKARIYASSCAFSPDGTIVAAGGPREGAHYTVKLWDVSSGQLRTTLSGFSGAVNSLVFSPDGKTLACSTDEQSYRRKPLDSPAGNLSLWDVATGRQKAKLAFPVHTRQWNKAVVRVHTSDDTRPKWLGYSSDGKTFGVAGHDLECVLKPATKTHKAHTEPVGLALWDVDSGRPRNPLEGIRRYLQFAQFSPDSKMLVVVSYDEVCIWDLASGRLSRILQREADKTVRCLAISPDGRAIALGFVGEIDVWDLTKEGRLLSFTNENAKRTLKVPGKRLVNTVAFSPDSKVLASASDEMIRLWDVAGEVVTRELKGHVDDVKFVAFSPDGRTLASGSDYPTAVIKLWALAPDQSKLLKPADQEQLQGTWQVTAIERDGKPAALGTGATFTFAVPELTIQSGEASPTRLHYKVDPTIRPRQLDVIRETDGKATITPMVFSLEFDTLTICYPPIGQKRPTKLSTQPNDQLTVLVLKREQQVAPARGPQVQGQEPGRLQAVATTGIGR
jgi:uncharacterized protein (TIGR03067 family)